MTDVVDQSASMVSLSAVTLSRILSVEGVMVARARTDYVSDADWLTSKTLGTRNSV